MGGNYDAEAGLFFSSAQVQDKRHKLKHREFPLNISTFSGLTGSELLTWDRLC